MWRNAVFATAATLVGIVFIVFSQIDFLIPYKRVLVHAYGRELIVYTALLAVNLFAAYALLARKLLLKNSGEKLKHFEKQLRDGKAVHELSARLTAEE